MWNLVGSTLIHVLTAIFTVTVWQFATRVKSPYNEPLSIGGGSAWSQLYDGPSANWASGQDERNQIPPAQPAAGPSGSWLGWGADVYNNRWAGTDAAVSTNNINSLVQTCSQKYNPGVSAPPLVLDGVAYSVTWGGLAVALDYRHCRPLWQTNVTRIIRKFQPTPNIAEAAGVVASVARTTPVVSGNTLFIGTLGQALVVALHRSTGRLIDSLQLSDHPFATITSSPTFYGGRLYVGVSSLEEDSIPIPGYKCCSFIGSMNAVSLRHGRLRLDWTVTTIPKHLNISGGAVWGSAPAIDPIRGQVFFATGNAYEVDPQFSTCQEETANLTVVQSGLVRDPCIPNNALLETIVALDLETGRINWARQMSPLDAWNLACFPALVPGGQVPPGVCPPVPGPDSDFGMAPTFVLGSEHTPHGLDIVVAGQKNGNLYALSAAAGTVLWTTVTGPTGLEGGLIWGMAVDDRAIYFVNTNSLRQNFTLDGHVISNSLFGAASLHNGRLLWRTPAPSNQTSFVEPSVANDVVLVGTTGAFNPASPLPVGPGSFVAINKLTGAIIKNMKLDGYFNGGVAAVRDYVMLGTGYGGADPSMAGSFQVWKLGSGTRVVDLEADEL